jgi:ankyrin repeat protein
LDAMEGALMPVDARNGDGETLLLVGCRRGDKSLVKACLRMGADVNAQNFAGSSALHHCYGHGFPGLADYMRRRGADDTLLDSLGRRCYDVL